MRILEILGEITAYSAVIFAITVLVKALLRKRLSPLMHYAIWSLFILRLILPVTLNSPLRPFTLPAAPETPVLSAAQPAGEQSPLSPDTEPGEPAAMPQTGHASPSMQTAPAPVGVFAPGSGRRANVSTWLLAVWLAGAAIGIGYIAFLYVRLRRRIGRNAARPSARLRALYRALCRELGIRKKVPLVCQYGLSSPGILFPACVLMPMETLAAMSDEQVRNTLRHELMHYRRGDHVTSVLLSLLNAVYWFNPIVWLAVKRIRADMETLCDSAVVRGMSAEQKGDYASLILELFSRSKYRPVVLGMAAGKSKAVVEKRIKGVFMNHKSQWGAKMICLLSALIMLIGCFTTACVPRERESAAVAAKPAEIVTSGDATSDEQAAAPDGQAAAPAPSANPAPAIASPLAQKLGVPVPWHFEQRSTDGRLLVSGDLEITLPDVSAVPLASAQCRDVTEADLMRAASAFFGPDPVFTYAAEDTKEYAEAYMEKNKEVYDSVIDGTCENKLPSFHKSVREQYEFYAALAQSAPSASERRALSPVFTEQMDVTGDSYLGFRGVAEKDGSSYFVSAGNGIGLAGSSAIRIAEIYEDYAPGYLGSYRSEPEGLTTTREQAVAAASAIAAQIDEGLALSHVMTVGLFQNDGEENKWANPWAWQCIFMRAVNGVGSVYDSRDVGSDIDSNVRGLTNEKLEITVDDRGVCGLRWINPLTVGEVTQPDAELLPFETIAGRLADQLREKYDYEITRENGTDELFMHHAELGLMRVGAPGSRAYTLEPVWSFFISFEEQRPAFTDPDRLKAAYSGDPAYWNSLTVSAIDGRVLDRDRGE